MVLPCVSAYHSTTSSDTAPVMSISCLEVKAAKNSLFPTYLGVTFTFSVKVAFASTGFLDVIENIKLH